MTANANTANDVLIVYASGSGNTQEVAKLISEELEDMGIKHDFCRVGSDADPNLSQYKFIFLGSYSVKLDGRVPESMKKFIERSNFYKPNDIAIFGTGDTQWAYFCGAAMRLAKYYNSNYPVLKIEQSPRGKQEKDVKKWTREVLHYE